MSGLELCPKCKKGHLYPVVTASSSAESKGQPKKTHSIRDYECAICGYMQKSAKQKQDQYLKDKMRLKVKKSKKTKTKVKAKNKSKD